MDTPDFTLDGIDHVALGVHDQAASVRWYREVLGLERRHEEVWGDIPAVLCAGDTCLALFKAGDAKLAETGKGMRHLAFRVSAEGLEQAKKKLDRLQIEWSFSDHEIAHSIYFADPDGYELELTTYEV